MPISRDISPGQVYGSWNDRDTALPTNLWDCWIKKFYSPDANLDAQTLINSIIALMAKYFHWLGNRQGKQPVKSWVLVCWWWWFDWSLARLIAPVVTTISIILSSSKILNGDILVLANPCPPGKWSLKWRARNDKITAKKYVYAWLNTFVMPPPPRWGH